jgi:hypothetical protein
VKICQYSLKKESAVGRPLPKQDTTKTKNDYYIHFPSGDSNPVDWQNAVHAVEAAATLSEQQIKKRFISGKAFYCLVRSTFSSPPYIYPRLQFYRFFMWTRNCSFRLRKGYKFRVLDYSNAEKNTWT